MKHPTSATRREPEVLPLALEAATVWDINATQCWHSLGDERLRREHPTVSPPQQATIANDALQVVCSTHHGHLERILIELDAQVWSEPRLVQLQVLALEWCEIVKEAMLWIFFCLCGVLALGFLAALKNAESLENSSFPG